MKLTGHSSTANSGDTAAWQTQGARQHGKLIKTQTTNHPGSSKDKITSKGGGQEFKCS